MSKVTQVQAKPAGSPWDKLTLKRLSEGKEIGEEFTVNRVTFNSSFRSKTAKPDGLVEMAEAKFVVKKKILKKQSLKKQ